MALLISSHFKSLQPGDFIGLQTHTHTFVHVLGWEAARALIYSLVLATMWKHRYPVCLWSWESVCDKVHRHSQYTFHFFCQSETCCTCHTRLSIISGNVMDAFQPLFLSLFHTTHTLSWSLGHIHTRLCATSENTANALISLGIESHKSLGKWHSFMRQKAELCWFFN